MNNDQAKVAMKEINDKWFVNIKSERSESGNTISHLKWMCEQEDLSENKRMRWLGYIQGVLVARGFATLEEMKDISRRASGQ